MRHLLALLAASLAVTVAAISLLTPLRNIYLGVLEDTRSSRQSVVLQKTADRLLSLSRSVESRQILEKAIALEPLNDQLVVELFVASVNSELVKSRGFDIGGYGINKHFDWVPLIAEGYRLAVSVEADTLHARVLTALALLLYFDPVGSVINDIEKLLRDAVNLDPAHPEAWLYLGFVLQQQARLGEADAAFKESVRLNPGLGLGWGEIASRQQQRGELSAALNSWQMAYDNSDGEQDWFFRLKLGAQEAVAEILVEDFARQQAGLMPGVLDAEKRLHIIDRMKLHRRSSNELLVAQALIATGRYQAAFEQASRKLDLKQKPRGKFYQNRVEALVLLTDIFPHLDKAPVNEQELQEAWNWADHWLNFSGFPQAVEVDKQLLLISQNLRVVRVKKNSRFARAGLRAGDRIETIAGREIDSPEQLYQALQAWWLEAADVPLLVTRKGNIELLILSQVDNDGD